MTVTTRIEQKGDFTVSCHFRPYSIPAAQSHAHLTPTTGTCRPAAKPRGNAKSVVLFLPLFCQGRSKLQDAIIERPGEPCDEDFLVAACRMMTGGSFNACEMQ